MMHRRADPESEIARIRTVVQRRAMPAFVSGFEVKLGEFYDDPAVWITFYVLGEAPREREASRKQGLRLKALIDEVQADILAESDDRYPFFRFVEAEHRAAAST